GRRAERCAVACRVDDRLQRLRVRVPERERPPGHHPVDVAAAFDVLQVRALRPADEEGFVKPDGAHGANRRVDAAGDQLERAAVEVAPGTQSQVASSFAQYDTITSAPARM